MNKGDHLVSYRAIYSHHGLYIGNGEVIHYSGFSEALDKGFIEITSLEDFKQGNDCKVEQHLVSIYSAEERIERAFSKLGEDSYNIVFNNCEHFVNWCFNGFKSSSQVNNVVGTASMAANEFIKRKESEIVISVAQNVARSVSTKTAGKALSSIAVKSAISNTTGTVAGITTASALTGTTATGFAALATGSAASVAAPVAIAVGVGVGVGYGVKKAFDWIFD